ncbi:MAG TPA: MCE family protein [Candidatus Avacidaminococcus intestinavium]|uniref:MCE family protein n=1 Tax=Candidatus Avacidaminococcus intestinavium TaxID=2840684 RepID=A0A9D1MNW1_9FIRM|nr:MCE family protein [Candidatus Avacidaminococcus intestinavium]
MNDKRSEVKVGAVALVGIALFMAIISFLGTFSFAGSGYDLSVLYNEVGGLKEGHAVRYAGVDVGTVRTVKVEGNQVAAVLKIKEGIQIPEGAVFSLGADGMLGEKFVAITPPAVLSGRYLEAGQTIKGAPGTGLDEFMASAAKALEKVEGVADALNNVLGDEAVQQSMRDGFLNLNEISANLNTFSRVMAEVAISNQQEVSTMITELSSMAVRMNSVATHLESIVSSADNNGETGKNVAEMANNLALASARIEKMSASLEKVVTDPKTEADLQETIRNAKETSQKANQILDTFGTARFQADVQYNDKNNDWLSNMGVTVRPSEDNFVYAGVYDLGGENKLDLQFGRELNDFGVRAGAMQGKFGVGMDYHFSDSFRVFTDIYDFDDTKVKVGGEIFLQPNFSLVGGTLDVRKKGSDQAYVGVRSYF